MAEQLQELLEKIQKDGVAKAEADAEKIIAAAREKAAKLVADAESQAAESRARAETEAQRFQERGRVALEQSARDVILSVRETLHKMLTALAQRAAADAVSGQAAVPIITKAVTGYITQGTAPLEVILSEADRKALSAALLAEWKKAAIQGVEIKDAESTQAGFRIRVVNNEVEHDFTAPAIANAMAPLLRTELADIVAKAAAKN